MKRDTVHLELEELADKGPASRRRVHIATGVAFVALIVALPLMQLGVELRHGKPIQELELFHRRPTLANLQAWERALEENSAVGAAAREVVAWGDLATLRSGNRKVTVGRGEALFYRPSLDAAISPGFMARPDAPGHPVRAVLQFRDALRRRGVELVLLPVPGKEAIYPEWLSWRYPVQAGPAVNPDMEAFIATLRDEGVGVIDPSEWLWRARGRGELYLRQDTHWTPLGLGVVADEVAVTLSDIGGPKRRLARVPAARANMGDLYGMLGLAEGWPTRYQAERVTTERVVDAETGEAYEPRGDATIVLLGDSFTNIYSAETLRWGDHAGLGEQLALRLGQDVYTIAQNDGGVNTCRAALARDPSILDGKKLVIWQFAARDLVVSNGKWQEIEIADR